MTTSTKLSGWASRWLTGELQALAAVGQWDAAIQTFMQMSNVAADEPVPGAIGSSTTSSPSSPSTATARTGGSSAFALREQQKHKVFHYTTLISACGKAGQWEAALKTFTHMSRARVNPNVRTYCSLLHACTAGERLDLALRAWAMMEADEIVPNTFATTALVSAFARAGRWDDALRLTVDAEKSVFPFQEPNIFTYTAAMDACRRAAAAQQQQQQQQQQQSAVIEEGDDEGGDATSSASSSSPARHVVSIIDRMHARALRPNTVSYTTALNACACGHDWRSALAVLERMRDDRVRLIPFGRACALEALADAPEAMADAGMSMVGTAKFRGDASEESLGRRMPKEGGDDVEAVYRQVAAAEQDLHSSSGGKQHARGDHRLPSQELMDQIQDPPEEGATIPLSNAPSASSRQ